MKRKAANAALGSSPVIRERSARIANMENALLQPPSLQPSLSDAESANNTSGFVEPELAPPQPGYSGYALESLPAVKQKRTWRKNKLAPGSRLSPEADPSVIEKREFMYRENLQTPELDRLTGLSELRLPLKSILPAPILRKRALTDSDNSRHETELGAPVKREKLILLLPLTPRQRLPPLQTTPSSRASRKIKIISPKRLPLLLVAPSSAPPSDSDGANNNEDFCSTCGGTGIFICCDLCPKSFHLLCCSPPLLKVPEEDDWNCQECRAARGIDPKPMWNDIGVFGLLLNELHGSNPTEFSLPRGLKESTFVNVYLGDDSQYMDLLLKEESPVRGGTRNGGGSSAGTGNGGQLPGFNKNQDLDVESLYDKNGMPHLCHKCGLLGLNRRTLIFCDYCPLVWHLDCLRTPMCVPKTLGLKWRCPNHVESLLPTYWLERRSFKDLLVVDSGAQTNFLRYLLASNFLIKFNDQPYLSDKYAPLLADYLHFQNEDFILNLSGYIDKWKEEAKNGFRNSISSDLANGSNNANNANSSSGSGGNSDDLAEELDPNFKRPPFLKSYGVHEGVVARSSPQLARVLVVTNGDDRKLSTFVYRVPEKQIVLDFVKKSRRDILGELQQYEARATAEQEADETVVALLLGLREPRVKVEGKKSLLLGIEGTRIVEMEETDEREEEVEEKKKEKNKKGMEAEKIEDDKAVLEKQEVEGSQKAREPGNYEEYEEFAENEEKAELAFLRRLVASVGKEKVLGLVSAI